MKRAAAIVAAGLGSGILAVLACGREEVVVATLAGRTCGPEAGCGEGSFCSHEFCGLGSGLGHCEAIADAAGCSNTYEPQCGCDGVTYYNDCLRRSASVDPGVSGVCTQQTEPKAQTCTAASDCPDAGGVCSPFLRTYLPQPLILPSELNDAGLVTWGAPPLNNIFTTVVCPTAVSNVESFVGGRQCWVLPQEGTETTSRVYDVCKEQCVDRAAAIREPGLYLNCPGDVEDASAD